VNIHKFLFLFTLLIITAPENVQIVLSESLPIFKIHRLLIILLLIFVLFDGERWNLRDLAGLPLKYLLVLSVFSLFISTIFSINFAQSFRTFLSVIIEFYFLFVCFYKINTDFSRTQSVYRGIFVAILISGILGLIQAYSLWNPIEVFPEIETRAGLGYSLGRGYRPWANFPHPILLGAAMTMGIPMGLCFLQNKNTTRLYSLTIWISIIIMSLTLYKTLSRGPMLALLLSLSIMYYFGDNNFRIKIKYFCIFALLLLILRPGIFHTLNRIYQESFHTDGSIIAASTQYRFVLMELTYATLSKDFFRAALGFGPSSFYYLNLKYNFAGEVRSFPSCDSSWISFLFSGGILYFSIMLSIFAKLSKISRNSIKMHFNTETSKYMLTNYANLLSFTFMMLFVAIYGWEQHGYLFWIIASLIVASSVNDFDSIASAI